MNEYKYEEDLTFTQVLTGTILALVVYTLFYQLSNVFSLSAQFGAIGQFFKTFMTLVTPLFIVLLVFKGLLQ